MLQLFHFLHRSFILRQGKVISLYTQHLDINSFLLTKFRQISSLPLLPCNCFIFLFADRLCKSHLLQCLSQTVACFHACFIAICNRNIINVQVRRCFIQVHNTIKQIQIGITFLKCFCILLQYFNGCFCLLCKISICIAIKMLQHQNVAILQCSFLGCVIPFVQGLSHILFIRTKLLLCFFIPWCKTSDIHCC